MARGVREIVALPDPVGEVIDGSRFANGLQMRKVRVPLGVVAVVYEARPNVTIDAAALCLKSGNAIAAARLVLGGALERRARRRSRARRPRRAGLPAGALALVAGGGREELAELAGQEGARRPDHPARRRGPEEGALGGREGAGDLRRVGQLPRLRRRERRPRRRAARSSSTRRRSGPGVCNAAETLLVHADVADAFLPRRAARAARRGRRAARRRAHARRRRRRRRDRARRRRRTTPRSSSRSCSRSASSTPPQEAIEHVNTLRLRATRRRS